jgi:hypothetical protein
MSQSNVAKTLLNKIKSKLPCKTVKKPSDYEFVSYAKNGLNIENQIANLTKTEGRPTDISALVHLKKALHSTKVDQSNQSETLAYPFDDSIVSDKITSTMLQKNKFDDIAKNTTHESDFRSIRLLLLRRIFVIIRVKWFI